MRLTDIQVTQIKQVLNKFLQSDNCLIYLYGSRTDDSLKGGDIDLLWIVPYENEKDLNIAKYKILTAIKKEIGDQRIDLGIISQSNLKSDEFYSQVIKDAIKL